MIAKNTLFVCLLLALVGTLMVSFTPVKAYEITSETDGSITKYEIWDYYGPRTIIENGTEINIEYAKDLRSIWFVDYLEYDPDYQVRVNALNYSYMDLCLSVSPLQQSKSIPFKFCNIESSECTQVMLLFPDEKEICRKLSAPQGLNMLAYNYTLGANSTSFWLRDADTESLDDGSWQQGDPPWNGGSATSCYMGYGSGNYSCMKKFNHTFLESDNITYSTCWVENSIISFTTTANTIPESSPIYAFEVINQSWTEDLFSYQYGVKWESLITTNDTWTTDDSRISFNITDWDQFLFTSAMLNSSVMLNHSQSTNLAFSTKESATIGARPEKNITIVCEDEEPEPDQNETAYGDFNITVPWCCDDYFSTIVTNKTCISNDTLMIEGRVWRTITSDYWNETTGYWDNRTAFQYCANGCYRNIDAQGDGCSPPPFDTFMYLGGIMLVFLVIIVMLLYAKKGRRR